MLERQSRFAPPPRPVIRAPAPKSNAVLADTGIDNFLRLIRQELIEPMKRVIELAGELERFRPPADEDGEPDASWPDESVVSRFAEEAARCADVTGRLLDLSEVLTGEPIVTDERIMLAESLTAAAIDVATSRRSRGVGIRLAEEGQELAPVYGSPDWMGLALRHLLALLARTAPAGTHILAHVRQFGSHQIVSGSTNIYRVAGPTRDLLEGIQIPVKGTLAVADKLGVLDLNLARAIVELHGGTLRTQAGANGEMSEFVVSLPTGDPQTLRQRPNCNECPFMLQTEQFARDIGELLAARRQGGG